MSEKYSTGLSILQKALAVNLDPSKYGTFAEIGAGQEVARFFFQAGAAAGTIAKSMSAYDMQVSDAIYGEESNHRYVSKSRLKKMLDREFPLLVDRVKDHRSRDTQYFVFANTVAAKGYKSKKDCHGWIGVTFQAYPGAEPSQILIHVRMLDNTNLQQQEALGMLGVNLIYGAFELHRKPEALLDTLTERLGDDRIEIDYCHFSGEAYEYVDNRLMALYLVKSGLTRAIMFSDEGEVVLPAEALYKKHALVSRGRFRPPTNVTMDMAKCAKEQFHRDMDINPAKTIYLAEITMAELMNEGEVDTKDFLTRIDLLVKLGYKVLISDYLRFFSLRAYLRRNNTRQIGFVLGVPNILDIFNEDFYEGLEGGILKACGLLFDDNTRLYVYPRLDLASGEVLNTENLKVPDHLKYLYVYLLQNNFIVPVENADESLQTIHSTEIWKRLKKGSNCWKDQVPELVYNEVVSQKLFGYDSE